ncbi:hypothetical protein BKA67DRAFT_654452 [Truncatella angustata]|uniref:Uncharacterized protein n=1 Tax=Truncatella angustata TaxID=152316 RepID=A0A9P8UZN8_9PEZI|nr:uncharacterized protein BKA67DRAFT_654452 [Truncatella angustata]KAH6661332.1 hypothetical protein BKA67DRAFT_654452 [Truncatella angustata]
MAPIQQTFSLIPELPSALNGGEQAGKLSRPPMTTKQAKKAYKAKNNGPKLSKAEQRRIELMEQDRIRREFEKERNQARARAARDKRKEKEEKENADKKKKGLPLVNVHPSQDTLARFVRKPMTPVPEQAKNGETKEPQAPSGEPRNQESIPVLVARPEAYNSEGTLSAGDETERPAKRQRVGKSPNLQEVLGPVPHNMFTPKAQKPEAEIELRTDKLPVISAVVSQREPAQKTSRFVPDDATIEELVNHQIFSESFSADDGLFDDIDIEAIKVKPTVDDAAQRTKLDGPPPRPPDCSPVIGKQNVKTQNRKEEYRNYKEINSGRMDCHSVSNATPRQRVGDPKSRGINEPRQDPLHTTNQEKSTVERITTHQILPDHSKQSEELVDGPLQTLANTKSPSGYGAPKQSRRLLIVAEQDDRKPVREMTSNECGQVRSHIVAQKVVMKAQAEKQPQEKPLKPILAKQRVAFSKPDSFRSPKTPIMGPPPVPPKFKTFLSTSGIIASGKFRFLPQKSPSSVSRDEQNQCTTSHESTLSAPPPSTQSFLFNNLDDLFPSPSQEVAEIFERPLGARHGISTRPKTAPPPPRFMPPACERPKTANNLSRHITSRSLSRDSGITTTAKCQETSLARTTSAKVVQYQAPSAPINDFMSLLSTQDVSLSSEDLMELGDGACSPTKIPEAGNSPTFQDDSLISLHCTSNIHLNHGYDDLQTPCGKQHNTMNIGTTPAASKTDAPTTEDRVLGSNYQPQHSSGLPETPSGAYPRVKKASRNGTPVAMEQAHKASRCQEDAEPNSSFMDDEIAELLDMDLEKEAVAGQKNTEAIRSANDQQTPVGTRPSPKPFFTSSGTKEKVYLAIEKTKHTAWRDLDAQRQAQQDLDILLKQEDEKQERVLLTKMLEEEEEIIETSQPDPPRRNGNFLQGLPRKEAGNIIPQSQRSKTSTPPARRRSQPQSSFEKMLQMLDKSKNDQNVICASQESDYGWDDDDMIDV